MPAQSPPPVGWLEAVYVGDAFSTSGALREDAGYLDNLDIKLFLDAGRALGWSGATAYAQVTSNRGEAPSSYVGDAQGVSNIEAPSSWRVYEAWAQQNLFRSRLSVLVGIYDINTEFDVLQSAGVFTHSSFGMGVDFGQSGANGPSSFPVPGLAVRLKYRPVPKYYVGLVVADGVTGGSDGSRTSLRLARREGALIVGEAATFGGIGADEPLSSRLTARNRNRRIGRGQAAPRYRTKLGVGAWTYTRRAPALDGPHMAWQRGAYVLGERVLVPGTTATAHLTGFLRLGVAESESLPFKAYAGGGLMFSAVPSRPDDETGIGFAYGAYGTAFRNMRPATASGTGELAVELTYRAQLLPWLAVQPGLERIVNPASAPNASGAWYGYLRVEGAWRFRFQ